MCVLSIAAFFLWLWVASYFMKWKLFVWYLSAWVQWWSGGKVAFGWNLYGSN